MEDTEGIKCFSESTDLILFSFAHLHSVKPLTKRRNNKCKTINHSSIFGKYFSLVDCHLNKEQFLNSRYKEFRNTFNIIY